MRGHRCIPQFPSPISVESHPVLDTGRQGKESRERAVVVVVVGALAGGKDGEIPDGGV